MSLNAKIARLQLGSLPDVVVKRLLRRQDIATLAEMGSAQVGVLGEFHFADIRAALSKGEFGTAIDVPRRRGGDTITMVRFETGLHSARISNGPEVVLPEFALLDSNASVRLSALSELEKRSKPCWSNCDHWRTLISERSLTDSEFGQVIEELQNVPERVLAGIAATVERGSFGVKDLIPVDRTYYESLVGRIPGAQTVDDYAALELSPHLARVLNTNSTWGIRCIQAANVSSLIDLVETSKSSTNESLIAALQASGLGKTSLGYLSTYLICQSRISGEGRFSEFAADALNRLTTQAARDDTSDGIEDLLLAFMRLTLNTISETELLWLGPPYWRRVAAFAHAYFLLDTIDFSTWNKAELISWCDAQQTINGTVIGILDFVREPAWRADSQTASGLSLAALMRAVNWSADAEVNFAGLSLTQTATIQALTPKFRLAFGLSDPLCGGQRRRGTATAPTIDEDLLQGFKNGNFVEFTVNFSYAIARSNFPQ